MIRSSRCLSNAWRVPPSKNKTSSSATTNGPNLFRYAKAFDTLNTTHEESKQKEVKVSKVDDFRIKAGINHVSYGAESTRLAEKFNKPVNPPLPQPKR